ncbi:MAG: carboxypeptidase regulatory-like domain-containing protein [Magnetococcales bacterium]|nr:carboxypeptidase regulatory-like domain-containing protein [Magnetococcales bacterium]
MSTTPATAAQQKNQPGFLRGVVVGAVCALLLSGIAMASGFLDLDNTPSKQKPVIAETEPVFQLSSTVQNIAQTSEVLLQAWQDGGQLHEARRKGSGLLSLTGLPAGAYTLMVRFDQQPAMIYAGQNQWTRTLDIASKLSLEGDTDDLLLTPTQDDTVNTLISGLLTHQGHPISGQVVTVRDGNGAAVGVTLSKEDGSFSVEGLQPGTYTLQADGENITGSKPVALSESTQTSLLLPMEPKTKNVKGRLVGYGAGTLVRIMDSNGTLLAATITGDNGEYDVQGIPANTTPEIMTVPNTPTTSSPSTSSPHTNAPTREQWKQKQTRTLSDLGP